MEAPSLVDEAMKKTGLVWLGGASTGQAVWQLWRDGASYVVFGGDEQPAPALEGATEVEVATRSKDNGARIVSWRASVVLLEPRSPEWDAIVPDLLAKRLNLPDADSAAERWARESRVARLTPLATADELPDDGHHAAPRPTPATTEVPIPFTVGGFLKRRRARRRAEASRGA